MRASGTRRTHLEDVLPGRVEARGTRKGGVARERLGIAILFRACAAIVRVVEDLVGAAVVAGVTAVVVPRVLAGVIGGGHEDDLGAHGAAAAGERADREGLAGREEWLEARLLRGGGREVDADVRERAAGVRVRHYLCWRRSMAKEILKGNEAQVCRGNRSKNRWNRTKRGRSNQEMAERPGAREGRECP